MSFKGLAFLLAFFVLFCAHYAWAQESDPMVQQIIEDMSEDLADDFDFSELSERLNFYKKHPVEINKITKDQLHELIFLTPLQINAFLDYRANGKLIDLLELQSIPGFDEVSIQRLVNFVYVGLPSALNTLSIRNLYHKGANDLMIRYGQYLQKQKGYEPATESENARYIGSPQRFLLRYRYNYGRDVSASLNLEKDPGEQFFPAKRAVGLDFSSANVFVKNIGPVKKAVIGDYSLQFGQGLALWSGLSFGKGSMITSLAKPELGLQPYRSTNEVLFFRGIASTLAVRSFEITPFLSVRKIDGGFEEDESGIQEISSMSQSGLHRTSTELANKNSVLQTVYGANVRYFQNNLSTGFTVYQTSFDKRVQSGQLLYNQFKFSGRMLTNLGIHYGYTFKNTFLFGEAAYSGARKPAFITGLMSSLSPRISLVLLHRHYPEEYHSFFNQAIAEASTAVTENGFYAGLNIKPAAKWDLSIYSDYFRFPWLKFGVDAPSVGYELLGQAIYQPSKKTKWGIRYKFEQKQDNDDLDNAINILWNVRKQSFRAEFSSRMTPVFVFRNRIELSSYQKETQNRELGWLVYQDIIYDPLKSSFSGNLRIALFDTPGFNSRIYAYENDVLFSYSLPAYQNKGLRFYVNGRYTITRKMDMWVRYSLSKYQDLDEIGSGLDLVSGSQRSEIKVQFRYQY